MKTKIPKKILVVRFSSIGDIVLTSPVVRCLKMQLDAEIHFVTKARFGDVVRHNTYIDSVFTFEHEITEIINDLKHEAYDLIVDLHKNLRSQRLKFLLGVPSISFDKLNFEKWLMVNFKIDNLPRIHLVDRYFAGLQSLQVANDGGGLDYFHGLDAKDMLPTSPYIVLVLGATYLTKRIPIEKIKIVLSATNKKIILLGGGDVTEEGVALQKLFPDVDNRVGKISLSESAAIVSKADFVVTGDTGLMHIAAAYKRPMIIFWGSTHISLGMYPYYGDQDVKVCHLINEKISCSPCSKVGKSSCPKGHMNCLLGLDDAKIKQAVLDLQSQE